MKIFKNFKVIKKNRESESVEILKYIDREKTELLKKKQTKEKKEEKIKEEIEELEVKINGELENVDVIVKSEAKIKILKNKMKIIEKEEIGELDKEYIKGEAEKNIIKLNEELEVKDKKIKKKIYYLLKEMGEYKGEAKEKHSKIKRALMENNIHGYFNGKKWEQGGELGNLRSFPEVEIQEGGVQYTDFSEHGLKYNLCIREKEFKNK